MGTDTDRLAWETICGAAIAPEEATLADLHDCMDRWERDGQLIALDTKNAAERHWHRVDRFALLESRLVATLGETQALIILEEMAYIDFFEHTVDEWATALIAAYIDSGDSWPSNIAALRRAWRL